LPNGPRTFTPVLIEYQDIRCERVARVEIAGPKSGLLVAPARNAVSGFQNEHLETVRIARETRFPVGMFRPEAKTDTLNPAGTTISWPWSGLNKTVSFGQSGFATVAAWPRAGSTNSSAEAPAIVRVCERFLPIAYTSSSRSLRPSKESPVVADNFARSMSDRDKRTGVMT